MKRVILLLMFFASPAMAQELPLPLWKGFVETPQVTFPQPFRISISESAYVEMIAQVSSHTVILEPDDGGPISAFFAALTNGVSDPITWTNGDWSYTVAEDRFFQEVPAGLPVSGFQLHPELTGGHTDLAGFILYRFALGVTNVPDAPYTRFHADVSGFVPEPSSALLMLCVGYAHVLNSGRRRRSV